MPIQREDSRGASVEQQRAACATLAPVALGRQSSDIGVKASLLGGPLCSANVERQSAASVIVVLLTTVECAARETLQRSHTCCRSGLPSAFAK